MKFLIIRFSSIGDVTQSLSLPKHILNTYPDAEIHFLTKLDFVKMLESSPYVKKVWAIEKTISLTQIFHLSKKISSENYTHLYDAHNNLRSHLFYFLIQAKFKLQKPMMRIKRFLLLNFKINLFEKPFSGQRDLLKPLEKWNIPFNLPAAPQLFLNLKDQQTAQQLIEKHQLNQFIILVPSAAHLLKRWPVEHWKKLIELNKHKKMIVLAGPNDHFTQILSAYDNVLNLTGQTTLTESAALIQKAVCVVANDTGLLHIAEQLGVPAIALMGPAPFGYPSRSSTKIFERNLNCWPCSKHGQGPCINSIYHECMTTITPEEISNELKNLC